MTWYLEGINSLFPEHKTFMPTVKLYSTDGKVIHFVLNITHEKIREMSVREIESIAIKLAEEFELKKCK